MGNACRLEPNVLIKIILGVLGKGSVWLEMAVVHGCLIVGDSIAKGVSDLRSDCTAYVKVALAARGGTGNFLRFHFLQKQS